jgi:hypothetical protein
MGNTWYFILKTRYKTKETLLQQQECKGKNQKQK